MRTVREPKEIRIVNNRTMVCVNPEPCEASEHTHWFKHIDDAITHSYYEREVCD